MQALGPLRPSAKRLCWRLSAGLAVLLAPPPYTTSCAIRTARQLTAFKLKTFSSSPKQCESCADNIESVGPCSTMPGNIDLHCNVIDLVRSEEAKLGEIMRGHLIAFSDTEPLPLFLSC